MIQFRRTARKLAAAVLALGLVSGAMVNVSAAGPDSSNAVSSGIAAEETLLTPRQVYEQNHAAVVFITSTVTARSYGQPVKASVGGSGFLISEDGYAVTNYHVVEGASDIKLHTGSGEEYPAELVGYDSANDVAVLKVDASGLPTVKLGNSDDLFIGDMVVAIGYPLSAQAATLTVGYCSGKNREITTDNTVINMIQTDVAINSGSSGGPLFNMYGEVVGITTAKYSGTSSSGVSIEGVSFAIPSSDVVGIITDLRDFGYVTGAYLGVTVQDSDATAASYYGLPTGAYVVSVVDGFAAAEAGLREKDIIIKIGDYTVSSVNDLTKALRHFKAGDTTTLVAIRSGERIELEVTLSEKPRDLSAPSSAEFNDTVQPSSGDFDEWYDYFHRYFFGEENGN